MESVFQSSISTWISKSLYLIGKCSSSTRVCMNQALVFDYLMTERTGLRQIMSGSGAEGTYTTASDVDRMHILPDIIVANKPDSCCEGKRNVFKMEFSGCTPGYATLQLPDGVELDHVTFGQFENMIEVTPEGSFLSSEKFVKHQLDHNTLPKRDSDQLYHHGPCISAEHSNIYGFHNKTPGQILETDTAFSLLCDDWPSSAFEWFTRERNHDWPNQDLIKKIRQQDCHVVPVGNSMSKLYSIEWRLSFLLGEKELIWNFNDTQLQCYIILKLLIKKHIALKVPDQVSSYHLKTTVFWQSEIKGLSCWTEGSLLDRVNDCLSYLYDAVKNRRLEHYFYRQNNLLGHKLKNKEGHEFVLKTISLIKSRIVYEVLDCLSDSCLVKQLWCRNNRSTVFLDVACSRAPTLGMYHEVSRKVGDAHKKYQAVLNLFGNLTDYLDTPGFLERMSISFRESPPDCVDTFFVEKMMYCLDIRRGISLYCSDRNCTQESGGQIFECLKNGSNLDDLVGQLYLASLHLCNKEYAECEDSVKKGILTTQYLLYAGRCSSLLGLEVQVPGISVYLTKEAPVSGEEGEVIDTTFDVVFSKQDTHFVPYPVKFECAVFPDHGERFFILHPFVYAYTLLFMSQTLQKNTSKTEEYLKYLAVTVNKLGNSPFLFRAYNLLGFCYSLNGQINQAMDCYIKSVNLTRQTKIGTCNAALYHLAILHFGVYSRGMAK